MQRRALFALSLLAAAASLAAGCNDLGSCDDPERGRKTVQFGGEVMYAGQAVMLRSCATGCHSSAAKGGGRQGAPAGLNFDLIPLKSGELVKDDEGTVTGAQIDPIELGGLRARQRKVFDEREGIWEQIDTGLMPPGDLGATFKDLMKVVGVTFDPAAKGCTQGEALGTLDNAKEELRNWLACGTPIVETNSPDLPFAAVSADAGAAETAAGTYAYAGQAGYQYPACEPAPGGGDGGVDGGAGVTFAQVYAIMESTDNVCSACHGGAMPMGNFDMGDTIDEAYAALVGSGDGAMSTCAAKPKYVVPNDPANSYILAMVDDKASGRCAGKSLMPLGSNGMTDAELKTITDWINGGALR